MPNQTFFTNDLEGVMLELAPYHFPPPPPPLHRPIRYFERSKSPSIPPDSRDWRKKSVVTYGRVAADNTLLSQVVKVPRRG